LRPALIDTSFIVALYNRSDRRHAQCVSMLDAMKQRAVTCEAVIAESCYMLREVNGAAADILATIASGALEIRFQLSRSAGRICALLEKYRDLPASFADACLVQMADELDTGDIFTLDSDFRHYRWRRNRTFNLLIPLD
jgi:predicted nucleic acid-binding protein